MKASKKLKAKEKKRKGKRLLTEMPAPWIPAGAVDRSMLKRSGVMPLTFRITEPAPGVLPPGFTAAKIAKKAGAPLKMAMDELNIETNAWAAQQVYNGAFYNGLAFMGYTYLSELAQRPEYRRISEVLATEMTRKWITFSSTATDEDSKEEKIKELVEEMDRLDVQGAFRKMAEGDGFFGRMHLYLDTGATDKRAELQTPIGNGRDGTSDAKFKGMKGFLKAVKPVEPVWCYPAKYNASDPLAPDWYNPQSWFVQGKEVHSSRLLTFVGREVPDMLKPSYQFGGLSLSQMAQPYVQNFLRTRQAVADVVWTFSVRGLKTDLSAGMADDGNELFKRLSLFANYQTNQGVFAIDKDKEDWFQSVTPLSGLDTLQAQSQEQMCSVTGTPVVKLLGIQPAGLNASSDGELTTWRDWVTAFQEKLFRRKLQQVIDWVMRSLWGARDPEIVFTFEQIEELSDLELADKQSKDVDNDGKLVEMGAIDPLDVRKRISADPDSPYSGLGTDPGDMPQQAMGLEGELGGEQPDLGTLIGNMGARTPEDAAAREGREGNPAREGDRRPGARRDDDRRDPARQRDRARALEPA